MRPALDNLIQVRVPAHLVRRMKAYAEARDKTVSELVRKALRDRIEKEAA